MALALLAGTAAIGGSATGVRAAAAQHPGRYLESRRAGAPLVYLASVSEVRQAAPADSPGSAPFMEATLTVGKLFRPMTAASPPPADAVVRYEQAPEPPRGGAGVQDEPGGVFYRMAAGDRALVFAGSFDKAFPIEMITGPPNAVSAQVSALRAWLLAMDEVTANLHGVTPAIRAQQLALYDRVLAELARAR